MSKEIQDIGDLFKAEFEEEKMEASGSNWSDIQTALDKIQFTRFYIYKFNIYYASLIVLTFLFSTYTLITNFISDKHPVSFQEEIKQKQKTLLKEADTIYTYKYKEEHPVTYNRQLLPSASIQSTTSKDVQPSEKAIDSLSVLPEMTHTDKHASQQIQTEKPTVTKKAMEEQRKHIYITKQDTVVIIDSIDSATARKRMKKNK